MKFTRLLILFLFFPLFACQPLSELATASDDYTFTRFGKTLFKRYGFVTMKEIHLDKTMLLGHKVVVEGEVLELGRYKTYMVVSDNTARMLVVLSGVPSSMGLDEKIVGKRIKILGHIEDGKKGLPFVQASALQFMR